MKTLVERSVEDPSHRRLYHQQRAIYEVTQLIQAAMKDEGVSRAELAKRLGKTKGWVTQLLDGEANKTIRTVADALAVLGREYHSCPCPIQVGSATESAASSNAVAAGSTTRLVLPYVVDIRGASSSSPTMPAELREMARSHG